VFKMFRVSDVAEVVAMRKDRFVKKYVLIAVLYARYMLFVVKFSFHFNSTFTLSATDFGE